MRSNHGDVFMREGCRLLGKVDKSEGKRIGREAL